MASWMIDRQVMTVAQLSLLDKTSVDEIGLFIRGPAGSGKTIMALHLANKISRTRHGKKVKVIVFTNILKDFITAGLEDLDLPSSIVQTAYSWRCTNDRDTDYLIVDEAQDFPINKEQAINANKKSGYVSEWSDLTSSGLILFGDFNQRIYDGIDWSLDELKGAILPFPLRLGFLGQNFRVPIKIAKVAAHLLPHDEGERLVSQVMNLDASAIAAHVTVSDNNHRARLISQVIGNMGIQDVGILVPSHELGRQMYDSLKRVGIGCEAKINNRQSAQIDFNSSIPKILTYHSAKGVQFETVFIPYGEVELENTSLLLVAVTRAQRNLFILHKGEICTRLASIPNDILSTMP